MFQRLAALPRAALTLALPSAALVGGCFAAQGDPVAVDSNGTAVTRVSTADMFDDPEIASILSASNQMEIQPSQLALERAQSAEVRQYAQRMIDHHSGLERQMQATLASKSMQPLHNAVSVQLERNLAPTLADLRAVPAAEFDVSYMLQQIASHEFAIRSLDSTLIPSARDPELRAMMTDTIRPSVAVHLDEAKRLHARLLQMQRPVTQR